MKTKIIILSLLMLCLLALPGSAWEQTFENHPKDADFSESDITGVLKTEFQGHGTVLRTQGIGAGSFKIASPWDGYVSYTIWAMSGTGSCYVGIKVYDVNGSVIFSDSNMGDYTTGLPAQRVEFIETTSGSGISSYINGVMKESGAYTGSGEPANYEILITPAGSRTVATDDYSSERGIIDTDASCSYTETGQYFKTGFPVFSNSYWFVRIYDTTGDMIDSYNVTLNSEYLIPTEDLLQQGEYEIAIYRHYSTTNQNIYYANKLFTNNLPSSASIELIDKVYAPGETVRITGHMSPFYPGWDIRVDGPNPGDRQEYELTQEDQTFLYVVPDNAVDGARSVVLRNPGGGTMQVLYFDVGGGTSGTTIRFDKLVYTNTNEIAIRYTDIPSGATITVKGTKSGTQVFSSSYTKTGSGIFVHQLTGQDINKVFVEVKGTNGLVLDSDTAEVANGEYLVSGVIYDTEDKTTISGALIECSGRQTTSSAYGKYSLIVPAGTQTFQISANGYTTQTIEIDVINITQKQDFYLVAVPVAGEYPNMLYGLVTDAATGEPLASTYIQISNSSTGTTYSTMAWTDTGHYSFDYPNLAGTWTLTAQHLGYENYKTSITINGQTYLQIKMGDADEAADDPDWNNDDSDSGSDSGDSGSSSDRPGREAAREAMHEFETITPGLIGLVVIKVIKELLK